MVVSTLEAAIIAFGFIVFGPSIVAFYRFSNRRIMHKIAGILRKEEEMREKFGRVDTTRHGEIRAIIKRMDAFEEKLDILLSAEGEAKESAREKITVRRR